MNYLTSTPKMIASLPHQHSLVHGILQQSVGLLRPLVLQRAISSYYMQRLELSRHKDVQTVHSGAVNDVDIDITENR